MKSIRSNQINTFIHDVLEVKGNQGLSNSTDHVGSRDAQHHDRNYAGDNPPIDVCLTRSSVCLPENCLVNGFRSPQLARAAGLVVHDISGFGVSWHVARPFARVAFASITSGLSAIPALSVATDIDHRYSDWTWRARRRTSGKRPRIIPQDWGGGQQPTRLNGSCRGWNIHYQSCLMASVPESCVMTEVDSGELERVATTQYCQCRLAATWRSQNPGANYSEMRYVSTAAGKTQDTQVFYHLASQAFEGYADSRTDTSITTGRGPPVAATR
ncbi:hypothetical protein BV22DRAFT_188567 [Leucogyrophana mollusca]|uniref:Uncharacterized protein n=1 Tax=Leucogyrophana mollusca TaxID=85980 RepID=A0ACB8BTV7_9AGAM|nr:hypothetical protein BV22DRAFT_188567 [Leucogyrophana mollusca]